MSIRRPYVAGSFYPSDSQRLRKALEDAFLHSYGPGKKPANGTRKRTIIGLIVPHAGYMFSGPGAAHAYYALSEENPPETAIIVSPNHTGLGTAVSMMGKGSWDTPLGRLQIDENLANEIFTSSGFIDFDESAHKYEHSIEVQLPFLQFLYGNDIKFIPITMGLQDLNSSKEVGEAIAKAVLTKNIVIIASTDLTHQETQESATRKDKLVLKAVESLDEVVLQDTVQRNKISMCGYGPVSVTIIASKILGATKAEILSYHTSGDITDDRNAVVGYASAKITRSVQ